MGQNQGIILMNYKIVIAIILAAFSFTQIELSNTNHSYGESGPKEDEIGKIVLSAKTIIEKTSKILETKDSPPSPNPTPDHTPDKCECKGTGFITHGDGHKTQCPCKICGCGNKGELNERSIPEPVEIPIRPSLQSPLRLDRRSPKPLEDVFSDSKWIRRRISI